MYLTALGVKQNLFETEIEMNQLGQETFMNIFLWEKGVLSDLTPAMSHPWTRCSS